MEQVQRSKLIDCNIIDSFKIELHVDNNNKPKPDLERSHFNKIKRAVIDIQKILLKSFNELKSNSKKKPNALKFSKSVNEQLHLEKMDIPCVFEVILNKKNELQKISLNLKPFQKETDAQFKIVVSFITAANSAMLKEAITSFDSSFNLAFLKKYLKYYFIN